MTFQPSMTPSTPSIDFCLLLFPGVIHVVCRCLIITVKITKKCSEEMQTLHHGCSKAEPKIFAPPQTRWDGQNLISWRWSLPLPTNPVWLGSMHTISSYHGNRSTHTLIHPPTDRQDRLQYTAPQLARSVTILMVPVIVANIQITDVLETAV